MHHDPTVWPNPEKFDPNRFLGKDGEKNKRKLMTFSVGMRMCIGRHLAICEIFMTLANLLRDYDFSLPKDFKYGPNVIDNNTKYPLIIPFVLRFILIPKNPETDCRIIIKHSSF